MGIAECFVEDCLPVFYPTEHTQQVIPTDTQALQSGVELPSAPKVLLFKTNERIQMWCFGQKQITFEYVTVNRTLQFSMTLQARNGAFMCFVRAVKFTEQHSATQKEMVLSELEGSDDKCH